MAKTDDGAPTVTKEDLSRCEKILDKLIAASRKHRVRDAVEAFGEWRSKIKDLEKKLDDPPKMKIAVYGDTGVGKSSLLNALFDEPDLLPTGGYGDACTSVITKIETVETKSSKEGYQAEILFIEKEEWEKEISVLKKDLQEEEEGDLVDEDEVRERAMAKLTAVYGEFKSEDLEATIHRRTDITEKLEKGKETTPIYDKASDLQEKIEDYMVVNASDTQYWPIVKSVVIRLINPSVDAQGIQVVDLPGVADTNPVRVKIADDEKQTAKLLLVLTKIQRGSASPTVKSIVGDNMYSEMEMDQQKNIIVCTRSDDNVDIKETKKEMKKEKKAEELEEIMRIEREMEESKRQHSGMTLQEDQKRLKDSRFLRCATFRNNCVKQKFERTTSSEVFCVSSVDYLKISQAYEGDANPPNFQDVKDTEIPSLRSYLQKEASKQRMKELEVIERQLHSIISDTYTYLLNFQIGGKGQSEEKVSTELNKIKELLNERESALNLAITQMYNDQLLSLVDEGVEEAVNSAVDICFNWGQPVARLSQANRNTTAQNGLACNTYRATVRRKGCFPRKRGSIDFNKELAGPLIAKIKQPWMNVFCEEQWEGLISSEVIVPAEDIFRKYSRRIQDALEDGNDLELGNNLARIREDALCKLQCLIVYEDHVQPAHRDAHRLIARTVQEKMISTYEQCATQTGTGSFDRMKSDMQSGVQTLKESVFEYTRSKLKDRLEDIKTDVCSSVAKALMNIQDDYKRQLDPLWNDPENKFLDSQVYERAKRDLLDLQQGDEIRSEREERERSGLENWEVPAKKAKTDWSSTIQTEDRKARQIKQDSTSQEQIVGSSGDSLRSSSVETTAAVQVIKSDDGDAGSSNITQAQDKRLAQPGGRSDATNYGKMVPDKESIKDMRLLGKTSQSIGLIGSTGTGFKVGTNLIMTASHVIAFAFGWQDQQFDSCEEYGKRVNERLEMDNNLPISFNVEDKSIPHTFLIKRAMYVNTELDVIIAQLEGDASHIPSLTRFKDNEIGEEKFHLLGHDGANVDQFRDPNCRTLTKAKVKTLKYQLEQLSGQHQIEEKNLLKYDSLGCSKEFLHFQCCFAEGASGSPGLVLSNGYVSVLTMLRAGYFPNEKIRVDRPDLCVEEGVRMKAVRDDLKKIDMNLCRDIFHRYVDDERRWYL